MTIKWYWLAEKLGLVRDVSQIYHDDSTWEVSGRCDEVFAQIAMAAVLLLLAAGFTARFFSAARSSEHSIRSAILTVAALLFLYALLLAVGIGPFIEFYPQSGGFIDLSALNHALEGVLCAAVAGLLCGAGSLGAMLGRKVRREKKI